VLILASVLALTVRVDAQAGQAGGDDWPQFRGAGARGVVDDAEGLPDRWSTTDNVAWVADIPGLGWSSPIVTGDTVLVTAVVSDGDIETPQGGLYFGGDRDAPTSVHHWNVYALDVATGALRWQRTVHSGVPDIAHHLKNTFASETPVTDGERLYVSFGNVGIFCFDLEGQLLWSRDVEPRLTRYGWGTAASPALHDGRLYVVNDNDEQSYLTALSAETGGDLWRVDRDEGTNWSTPFVWEHEGRTELVTTGTDKVRSYDLQGGLLWELTGMSSITIPTPFAEFGLLYIASGYVGDQVRPVFAIRPGASGDISLTPGETSNDYIAWYQRQASPYNPSPILYGDIYYTLLDRGFFTAHDARTGQEVYSRQRLAVGAAFTSSPWAYDGKIFALSEEGDTYVIRAGVDYEVLGTNALKEFSMATPAIAQGSLFIRTASKLYRITDGG
jgi:outer membrane protein assembly factor BamB